ncbi:MAG: leucyl/phenylalanyl-tRNA--protein transferase [Myxococcaceae bacterium]
MPVFRLGAKDEAFPPAELADESGVLAVGGTLSEKRLLAAYAQGIFPWPIEGYPLLWHSPDPRFVLSPETLHIPRSVEKALRRHAFEIRLDTAFADVIQGCKDAYRPGQHGTWITPEMQRAYTKLHRLGYAHSIEAWQDNALQGGLYGVSLGAAFFGESMFAKRPDASKVAFATLARHLFQEGFQFIDCQVETEHLARFGATHWPRKRFLDALEKALAHPTRRGPWTGWLPAAD